MFQKVSHKSHQTQNTIWLIFLFFFPGGSHEVVIVCVRTCVFVEKSTIFLETFKLVYKWTMGEENKQRKNQELLDKLEQVGDSPRFVWKLFLLCMVPSILNGLNVTSYVYLTDVPDHWCHVSELDNTSWTHEQILQITSPRSVEH